MNASRSCMIIVFSLLIASFEFVPARADLFNDDQKDLVADIAKGAGGVLQQIIATRGAIRTAEVQAQAQAAAAVAAAQPPPVAPNVVPVNQLQAPQFQQGANPAARFQPIAAGVPFQPTFQGPYGAGGQYQGYPGYPGYPANPGYPAYPGYPGYPPQQQGFPQQVPVPPTGVPFQGGNPGVNPAANPGANPAVNPGVQGVNNGPNACSATDSSPQAVSRAVCISMCYTALKHLCSWLALSCSFYSVVFSKICSFSTLLSFLQTAHVLEELEFGATIPAF